MNHLFITGRHTRPHPAQLRQAGLTLVELLVAVAVGLVLVIAVSSLVLVGQSQERKTAGASDLNQNSAYASIVVDQAIRGAGAGFLQRWSLETLGCLPHASRDGVAVLPRSTALPAPFADFLGGATGSANLRMAPLLIAQGQSGGGSDILVTMGGGTGIGDIPRPVRDYLDSTATQANVRIDTTLAVQPGDVLLLNKPSSENCLISQVKNDFVHPVTGNEVLPLGGRYYRQEMSAGDTLRSLTADHDAMVSGLGSIASGNVPMQLFGVGADSVLYRYDLLNASGSGASDALSEGVVAMRAIYSVDANVDLPTPNPQWVAPTGSHDLATLLNMPAQDRAQALRNIVGVRVSLLLRGAVLQVNATAPQSFTLLEDLPGETVVNLSAAQRRYSHQLVESTIPLRNALMVQP